MRSLQLCENSTWFCWWYYSQCRCLLWHLDILFIFCHYLSTAFVCEIISKIYNKIVLAHLCYKIYRNALVTWFAVSFLAALNFIPSVKVNMLSFLAPKNIISIHCFHFSFIISITLFCFSICEGFPGKASSRFSSTVVLAGNKYAQQLVSYWSRYIPSPWSKLF